ncbi:MAG: hypothetical protein MK102_09580 [Fuerstiella sp.]|nr:hypothetical protein [Fuerstiella sp.]
MTISLKTFTMSRLTSGSWAGTGRAMLIPKDCNDFRFGLLMLQARIKEELEQEKTG